jgi:hypothetical protein
MITCLGPSQRLAGSSYSMISNDKLVVRICLQNTTLIKYSTLERAVTFTKVPNGYQHFITSTLNGKYQGRISRAGKGTFFC